jgi:hypothetical protein
MTAIKDVELALSELFEHELAKVWMSNDIVKRKLAASYDAWISDIHDHKLYLTLIEHIETCLDTPEYIDYIQNP